MKQSKLTDAKLLVLGLVAEMPRHGYELEQVIEQRGMREWTPIGFSSIYFVLDKLEKAGFVTAETPTGSKTKKTFSITHSGEEALLKQTLEALSGFRPTYSSALLGMIHWSALSRKKALAALEARGNSVCLEIERLERVRYERQPLPDFIEALFDFSAGQMEAEKRWIGKTLDYMKNKP
ncbi:MAG: PadR family transcriptional regulator [Candidatus Thiodiazotropha sp. (ex Dulcina madagascariensis)]|nr:PadR family transcriptional regulator [Candidatus Thiodiazotropha sp. (ex Dulcina madagascariensis)]MCU7927477.1 PadR family transcriptional regulator [Candidatus Thiodiazotropha sp. (ex Dulcina madagascariensis)]